MGRGREAGCLKDKPLMAIFYSLLIMVTYEKSTGLLDRGVQAE